MYPAGGPRLDNRVICRPEKVFWRAMASSGLRERGSLFLPGLRRAALGPVGWSKLVNLGDFGRRQAGEEIPKIVKGIKAMASATAQESINDVAALARCGASNEQPGLLALDRYA